MPWDIRTGVSGCSGYAVVDDKGKTVGCHTSRSRALAQQRALYASGEYKTVKKQSDELYESLTPEEKAFHDALLAIAEEYGPFDLGTSSIWVGYESADDNEDADIGVKCGNCSFYMIENSGCMLLSYQVEENGKCRLAAIPDDLVNPEMDSDDMDDDSMDDNGDDMDMFKRDYSEATRQRYARQGIAMPDGSYPIANRADLRRAIQAVGRASDYEAAKRHIIRRARALGATDMLPEEWRGAEKSVWSGKFSPGFFTKARNVKVGDSVSWNSSGGTARGKVTRIVRDGQINVPDSSFTITGTPDDPALLIRLYRDGEPTDTYVGHKMSTVRIISDL